MFFDHPYWLWLLILVPVLSLLDWRARGKRRLWTTLLRGSIVAAVVLAIARPLIAWQDHSSTLVTVLDLSLATTDQDIARYVQRLVSDRSSRGTVHCPIVVFGNYPQILPDATELQHADTITSLRQQVGQPLWPDDVIGGSNLADALRLAGTLIPIEGRGSVRLISAGHCDHADALAEAWRLAQRGIAVDTTSLAIKPVKSVAIQGVTVPGFARVGQTIRSDIVVEASVAGRASVHIMAGDNRPVDLSVELSAGVNHLTAMLPMSKSGLTLIRAEAWMQGEIPRATSMPDAAEQEVIRAAVDVGPAANVLLVQDPDGGAGDMQLSSALSALLGPSVAIPMVSPAELSNQRVRAADAIVLADVPADQLSGATQLDICNAVNSGTGLFLTGSARSFGPGGYDKSQLAPLLPVKMPQQMESIDPSTTLVLIIDTSGSMAGESIDIAKSVARLALSHLKPHDKVGIVEFYGGKRWAAPIQSAGNLSVINRALDRLTAGGGTTLYPAVEEAAFALRNVRTRTKHVLICSDGFVEDVPFSKLILDMADNGVVVSTVQVAPPGDGPNQMADLARWGNGRYYTVFDHYVLPDISLKQPRISLTSPLVHTPSSVMIGEDPLVRGIQSDELAPVEGYLRTQAKPSADVLLKTSGGDPLLARWRYGAGFVAVLPTQLGSVVAQSLQNKPAFAQLLADLFRQIDSGRGSPLRVTAMVRPAGVEVNISALDFDSTFSSAPIQLIVSDDHHKVILTATCEAISTGRWNLLLPGLTFGAYRLSASFTDVPSGPTGECGIAVAPTGPILSANTALLDQIAAFGPIAGRKAAALPPGHLAFFDTRPWLIVAAVVLLLAHVAVRRWPRRTIVPRNLAGADTVVVNQRSVQHQPVFISVVILWALLATKSYAALSTQPPATTAPITQVVNWERRIDAELVDSGHVEQVAADLAAVPANAPGVTEAKVRVAIERGDLSAAINALQAGVEQQPDDPDLLRRLGYFQELDGATGLARETLTASVVRTHDAKAAADVKLRLATLAFDEDRADDGNALLNQVAATSVDGGARAGVIAYLYGQYAVAARLLDINAGQDVALRLMAGNAALKAGQSNLARSAFEMALTLATKPADRLYAQERLIASARAAGTLPALADSWLGDKQLPSERLLPLATVLRELGRTSELLDWWRESARESSRTSIVLSDRFVLEVLGAAKSAGKTDQAVEICRELLALRPDDPQWLSATLGALLSAGQTTDADALLDDRARTIASNPVELETLGKLARSFDRDAATVRIARRLTSFGGGPAIAGDLLEASIDERADDHAGVVHLLQQAASIALDHPVGLGPVVSALESANLTPLAIQVLQKSYEQNPSKDSLERLASLLLREHRTSEATVVLTRLMRTGTSESIRAQAAERLLDATAATGKLPELVQRLRDNLSQGGTEQDLSTLVNAQLRLKDSKDAATQLQQTKLLDEPTRDSRLAVLYLRTKDYDSAAGVLRQLVSADPNSAIETLERLADTLLRQNKPLEAAGVIDQIKQRIGPTPASAEMMAGVLDRLGRFDDAAASYRSALAQAPRSADDWLLWSTAQTKAGHRVIALHRLQVLCGDATSDAMFATVVDGLLNLSAPVSSLQAARRDAIMRVAEHPHSAILYQVIADLSDELQDNATVMRAADAGLQVSDEERPQHLRELIDIASRSGATDTAVDCGRSLLALGDDFPPQLFLQLGEQLLIGGRQAEASRAFSRATENSDAQLVALRSAALYEKYGYPADALDALRPFAERLRNDPDYLESVARLSEVGGNYGAAFKNNLAAIEILGRQIAADKTQPLSSRGGMTVLVFPSQKEVAFDSVVIGAITTALSADQEAEVLRTLRSIAESILSDCVQAPGPPRGLITVVSGLRRAAFTLARPDVADSIDAAVLARWPNADDFKRQALLARLQDGFVIPAYAFSKAHGIDPGEMIAAAAQDTAPRAFPATLPADLTPQFAAPRLAALLAHGHVDGAKALLAEIRFIIPPKQPRLSSGALPRSPLLTIITAATFLGDQETATKWAIFWVDGTSDARALLPTTAPSSTQPQANAQLGGSAGRRSIDKLQASYDAVAAAWPLLENQGRSRVLDHFIHQVESADSSRVRGSAAIYALRSASSLKMPWIDTAKLAEIAINDINPKSYDAVSSAAQAVLSVAPEYRVDVLHRALQQIPKEKQLTLLTAIVAGAAEPLDSLLTISIVSAAKAVAAPQLLEPSDWWMNASQKALLGQLAESVLRTATTQQRLDRPADLAVAAAAFSTAADPARADATAVQAIQALRLPPETVDEAQTGSRSFTGRSPRDDVARRIALLRVAAAAMSAEAREKELAGTDLRVKAKFVSQPDLLWLRLLRSILMETTGRRTDALAELRAGYRADPTDGAIARVYLDRLIDDGRWSELVKAFPRQAAGTDGIASQAMGQGLVNLYRWRESRASIETTDNPQTSIDFAAAVATGDKDKLAAGLRGMLQAARTMRGVMQLPRMPQRGGLDGMSPSFAAEAPAIANLAQWPASSHDLIQAVCTSTASSTLFNQPAAWIPDALARACVDPDVFDQVSRRLDAAAAADSLNSRQRRLITELAIQPHRVIPPLWLEKLWSAALVDDSGVELKRLGEALAAQHQSGSTAALEWADAIGRASAPTQSQHFGEQIPSLVELCNDARLAAERNDIGGFSARIEQLLGLWAWHRCESKPAEISSSSNNLGFDLCAALPTHSPTAGYGHLLTEVLAPALQRAAQDWPSNTDIPRQLALLGNWAHNHREREAAELLLTQAQKLSEQQGPGEQQLWVADLAAELGHAELANELQSDLLRNRCLPVNRIEPTLSGLRQRGKQDTAQTLLKDSWKYCSYPTLADTRPHI